MIKVISNDCIYIVFLKSLFASQAADVPSVSAVEKRWVIYIQSDSHRRREGNLTEGKERRE